MLGRRALSRRKTTVAKPRRRRPRQDCPLSYLTLTDPFVYLNARMCFIYHIHFKLSGEGGA